MANTEDGNELDKKVLELFGYLVPVINGRYGNGYNSYPAIRGYKKFKEELLHHIQSNYILKSDVEGIIGEDEKEKPLNGGPFTNTIDNRPIIFRNSLRNDQRIKASQYGLTIK